MGSVLYGVTMQEPGVSKLVSVKWEEQAANARGRQQRAPAANALAINSQYRYFPRTAAVNILRMRANSFSIFHIFSSPLTSQSPALECRPLQEGMISWHLHKCRCYFANGFSGTQASRPRQSPRPLRSRRRAADRRDRPAFGFRRGAADADPGQGTRADAALAFLVRQVARCGAQSRALRATEFRGELAPYAEALRGPVDAGAARREPLPIECVVRGYLSGSGWKDYQETGAVCGIALPTGLRESDSLPRADFHAVDQGNHRPR